MNLNINYILNKHRWSTCTISVNNEIHNILITHILPHHPPLEECMLALITIMKGNRESVFYWMGEPNGVTIHLKEKSGMQDWLHFIAYPYDEADDKDNERLFQFEVSKQILVTHFYFEFKKISVLLNNASYAQDRNGEFPFQLFYTFEKHVLAYLELSH